PPLPSPSRRSSDLLIRTLRTCLRTAAPRGSERQKDNRQYEATSPDKTRMNSNDHRGLLLFRTNIEARRRCCSRHTFSNRIAILHIRNTSLHGGQEAVWPRLAS